MANQKQQEKDKKFLEKILKVSNKKLWDKLSDKKRDIVINKYYNLTDIENRGIQNVLSDIRQNRISLGSIFLGFILGIFGGMTSVVLEKYTLNIGWRFDVFVVFCFLSLCVAVYKLIDEITYEDFKNYKVLEHLLKLAKKDKKVKKRI